MNYYVVHLPISLRQEYHYRCEQSLAEGTRVLVSFNRRDMIGICGKACSSPPDLKVRFKPVLEVLDARPVLSSRLLRLAEWMASYYQCSVGSACFAMLPAYLPDIDEVRWLGSEIPDEYARLHGLLSDGEFHKVSELRKALKGRAGLAFGETGEEAGYLN